MREDFEKLMLEAVDEGLSALGASSKQAIYFHLDKSFDIKREQIPDRLSAFAQAIESIFGPGASCIEVLIMRKIHERVEGVVEWDKSEGFSFIEYVSVARRSFQGKTSIKSIKELAECEEEGSKV